MCASAGATDGQRQLKGLETAVDMIFGSAAATISAFGLKVFCALFVCGVPSISATCSLPMTGAVYLDPGTGRAKGRGPRVGGGRGGG